jgi:hypothetical protein
MNRKCVDVHGPWTEIRLAMEPRHGNTRRERRLRWFARWRRTVVGWRGLAGRRRLAAAAGWDSMTWHYGHGGGDLVAGIGMGATKRGGARGAFYRSRRRLAKGVGEEIQRQRWGSIKASVTQRGGNEVANWWGGNEEAVMAHQLGAREAKGRQCMAAASTEGKKTMRKFGPVTGR